MAVARGQEQRRAAVLVDRIYGGAGGQQELGDSPVASGAGGMQRGHAVHGAGVGPRASGDKLGHHA